MSRAAGVLPPSSHDREQARARLLLKLARYPSSAIPCHAGNVLSSYWTSEDPEEAAAAAVACRRCPALLRCVEFIVKFPDEAGVYGASTEADRRDRRERRATYESPPDGSDPMDPPPTAGGVP